MTIYKINPEPSTLPDSTGKEDLVLIATERGSRNGERLAVGNNYHVTIIDDEDVRHPGHVLHVDKKEGRHVLSLENPNGTLREITQEELSGMKFEFIPSQPVV